MNPSGFIYIQTWDKTCSNCLVICFFSYYQLLSLQKGRFAVPLLHGPWCRGRNRNHRRFRLGKCSSGSHSTNNIRNTTGPHPGPTPPTSPKKVQHNSEIIPACHSLRIPFASKRFLLPRICPQEQCSQQAKRQELVFLTDTRRPAKLLIRFNEQGFDFNSSRTTGGHGELLQWEIQNEARFVQ